MNFEEGFYEKYEGTYKDNQFHGNGTLLFKNGDFYTGQFKMGQFNGYGKMTFGKENIYDPIKRTFKDVPNHWVTAEGTFKNGALNGNGDMRRPLFLKAPPLVS